jgi:hypothetical protein
MRDEQVNLYADWLPRGTYVYTYQVRATVPGEFQTMPTTLRLLLPESSGAARARCSPSALRGSSAPGPIP